MILDYLLFHATKALLEDRKAEEWHAIVTAKLPCRSSSEHGRRWVRSAQSIGRAELANLYIAFLTVFKANHTTHHASLSMQFRLHLLRYTTLSTRRISNWPSTPPLPSLNNLRWQNRERASTWSSHRGPSSMFLPRADPMLHIFTTAHHSRGCSLHATANTSLASSWPRQLLHLLWSPELPSLLDTLPGFMASLPLRSLCTAQEQSQGCGCRWRRGT
jgi:hypothetical protein